MDFSNELVVLEYVFAAQVAFGRKREELVEWDFELSIRAHNGKAGSQSYQHRRQIRRVNYERRPTAENRVVLVLSGCGKALRATLFQTLCFFQAKVPAARPLAEVTSDSPEVTNLLCGDRVRSLRQPRVATTYQRILFHLSQGHQRSDSQAAFRVSRDFIEAANSFEVYHSLRPR